MSKDEIITNLLETMDAMIETIEDNSVKEADLIVIQPLAENLREEIAAIAEI